MARSYPLQPLSDLRDQARQAAERQLAASLGALEQARAARERAVEAVEQARGEERAFAARQREKERGPLTPADLELARGFARRLAAVTVARQKELDDAGQAQKEAEQRVEQDRRAVTEAEQACEAVERHRERWQADQRRARERQEEAQQDDRRSGTGGPPAAGKLRRQGQ